MFFQKVGHISCPYKTKGNIVWYIVIFSILKSGQADDSFSLNNKEHF